MVWRRSWSSAFIFLTNAFVFEMSKVCGYFNFAAIVRQMQSGNLSSLKSIVFDYL